MRSRKTIKVDQLRRLANDKLHLALNDPETRDHPNMVGFRRGVMLMIEHVLHETGNYRGFVYLASRYPTMDLPDDDTLRIYL